MFKNDIMNFHELKNTEFFYYTSVPDEFWGQMLTLFQKQGYRKDELKLIIDRCAKNLFIQFPTHWNERDLLEDARTLLRVLHEHVQVGRIDILMDCLCFFLMPSRFTEEELNLFLFKNKIGYVYDERRQKWEMVERTTASEKSTDERKVFVSHSSADKEYVLAFVDFLEDIGFKKNQIFCSSIPEYGIPLGEDIYDYLYIQFRDYNVHMVYMLSENYYNSAACLNEMGATWILQKEYTTILLPGFQYRKILGAVDAGRISLKLDEEEASYRLRELRDELSVKFCLPQVEERQWERYVSNFLEKCRRHKHMFG